MVCAFVSVTRKFPPLERTEVVSLQRLVGAVHLVLCAVIWIGSYDVEDLGYF